MWRRVAVLVVVAACRYEFDPIGAGDGAASSGADAHLACTPQNQSNCVAAGGTCDDNICTLQPAADVPITCPANMTCHVLCPAGRCSNNSIVCPTGATCALFCTGDAACESDALQCTGATCTAHCDHDNTCQGLDIQCSSGACDLRCCANNVCNMNSCTTGCVAPGACP